MRKSLVLLLAGAVPLSVPVAGRAQRGAATPLVPSSSTPAPGAVPDAPSAAAAKRASQAENPSDPTLPDYGAHPGSGANGALTGAEKARYALRHAFGPGQFIGPAFAAGIQMASPRDHYPPDWRQGGAAYGRLYGADFAQNTAADAGRYLTGGILREDPRYFPSADRRPLSRLVHAVLFTLVDRSDSGGRRIAVSSFAGAAAGGFVGTAYLPDGNFTRFSKGQPITFPADFTDATHAGQRSLVQLGSFAADNVSREFDPEIRALARKLHLPVVK